MDVQSKVMLFLTALFAVVLIPCGCRAQEVCSEKIEVSEGQGQAIKGIFGSVIEAFEDEGGGDTRKHRHLYLHLIDTVCFKSKGEGGKAAALNLIQLYWTGQQPPSGLQRDELVTIDGVVTEVHVGRYFSTPFAIKVTSAKKAG
jgi:hypothetical protein